MATSPILNFLKDVRPSSENKYTACCPAHQDSTARLGIRIELDGRPIFHCWAGCDTQRVLRGLGVPTDALLASINMEGSSLKPIPIPFNHFDAMAGLHQSILEASLYADQLSKGISLSVTANQRLQVINQCFHAAYTYINSHTPFKAFDALADLCVKLSELCSYADQMAKGIEFTGHSKQRLAEVSKHLRAAHDHVCDQQQPDEF